MSAADKYNLLLIYWKQIRYIFGTFAIDGTSRGTFAVEGESNAVTTLTYIDRGRYTIHLRSTLVFSLPLWQLVKEIPKHFGCFNKIHGLCLKVDLSESYTFLASIYFAQ